MNLTALIFGASGLIGRQLLHLLLESSNYKQVKAFVRKELPLEHPKLCQIVVDFDALDQIASEIKGEHIYLCLGTTMAKAGNRDAFYKVDYSYTIQASRLAFNNGAYKLCLISSLGANAHSSIFYSKVKGLVERDVSMLNFKTIHIIRPSLLLGERSERRIGEQMAILFSNFMGFVFVGPLKKYRPIKDTTVARAMYFLMQEQSTGLQIHQSIDIQNF